MSRFARSAVALAGVIVLLTLAACGGSSPAPTPSASPTPPLAELSALAGYFGAQEAWWMAVTQAEAQRLVDDPSWTAPDPSPPATTYVVLMRGDFNDAGGRYKGWAVTAGRVGADTTTVVMSTRPELADHNWTALDLLLASGQLSGARSETVDLGVHELGKDVRLAWTLTGGPESRAVFRLRLVRTSDGLGASSTLGPMSFPGEMTRITNDRGLSLGGLEPGSYHAYVSEQVRPAWPEGIAADFELYTSAR